MKDQKTPQGKTIKLDQALGVIAAAEAVRLEEATDLLLELPQPPGEFRNFFNLRLLQQISLISNKRISLVTADREVVRLASHLKIPVVAPPKHPPAAVKKTPLSQAAPKPRLNPQPARRPANRLTFPLIFLLIVLGGLSAAYFLWPSRATVEIKTYVTDVRASIEADLSQAAQVVDEERKILPLRMVSRGTKLQYEVEVSGTTAGTRADGVIKVHNCSARDNLVIDSQTVFVKDGLEFRLKGDDLEVLIPPADNPDDCEDSSKSGNSRDLRIEAAATGSEYNLETGVYQITDLAESDYSARGFGNSGGSDPAGCITEDDLEAAKEELSQTRNDTVIKREMIENLRVEHGLIPLEGTFQVATAEVIESPVCPEVADSRISQVLIYYMGGVRESDVAALAAADLQREATGLTIVGNGLDTADYDARVRLGGEPSKPTVQQAADLDYYVIIDIVEAKAGIILDEDELLEQIAGREAKQAASSLRRLEGIEEVKVSLSPIWASDLPTRKGDILLKIDNQGEVTDE